MDADDGGSLMQERFDLRHKFLRQIFKLRAETCLHALSGPHQFFTNAVSVVPLPRWVSTRGAPKKLDHCSTRFQTWREEGWAWFARPGGFPVLRISVRIPSIATVACGLPSLRNRQMVSISISILSMRFANVMTFTSYARRP